MAQLKTLGSFCFIGSQIGCNFKMAIDKAI
jgi:hypothetical protein